MMNKLSLSRFKYALAPLLLAGIPTLLLSMMLLLQANRQLGVFQDDWLHQGVYWGLGLFTGMLFYGFRFRFFVIALVIYLVGGLLFSTINQLPLGESFAFEWSLHFYLYGTLFFTGFIIGFCVLKWRAATILWLLLLTGALVLYLTRSTQTFTGSRLTLLFLLLFAYSVYLLYATELIRKNRGDNHPSFSFFLRRTGTGLAIVMLLTLLAGVLLRKDFDELANRLSEGHFDQKNNTTSMTKRNKDGSVENNDKLNLTGGLSKGKNLVFVAHLNSFMEDGRTPNPLYFTAFYYTKFDSVAQSFLTDDKMPANDLFKPNPSAIPLYFNKVDSNVIRNTKATLQRKVVSAEVYKVSLSPDEFIAPATAFLCQPISVPKEYQNQFKSAYRAQMWVSKLNSAYFVYNPGEETGMQIFQQRRFDELRKAADYASEDPAFMQYYTRFPHGPQYEKISALAHQIGDGEGTVMDKMLAIRSYFLQKDESGKPLFQYSDNPGIPGIPTANKLDYFLFQNRKGYCAYYAGATLLLLRAMGIPSRIAAGFMAIDRSSKNPGWYWFYANQAHAWVQVYFPGYGWMDFDTTIPDVNTQQAPQPDGTPPLGNLETYFVADGNITAIDRQKKQIAVRLKHFIIQQKNFDAHPEITLQLDAAQAKISADSGTVDFSALQTGMHVTAASDAEALKNLKAETTDQPNQLLSQLSEPVPVDEVRITLKDQQKKEPTEEEKTSGTASTISTKLWSLLCIVVLLMILFYSIPWTVFLYLKKKASRSVFYTFQASSFYLSQLGYAREQESPDTFARKMDQQFGTDLTRFTAIYQKYKYSPDHLSAEEQGFVRQFLQPFVNRVNNKIPRNERWKHFLNPFRTFQYFSKK